LDPTPTSDVDTREPRSEIRLFDVAAVFCVSIITAAIGISIGLGVGGEDSYAVTIGSLVGLWAGLVPGTLLVCRARGTGKLTDDVGLQFKFPDDFHGVWVGLASQFVLLPIVYVIVQAFVSHDLTKDLEKPAKELTDNANGPGFWLLAVLLIVGAPLVEEIFYRGLLLRSLKRYMPVPAAIVTCGVVFGAAHFSLITLPGLALFGIVLAYLCERFGRLGPNIVAHAAFNAATVLLLWHG
jgi:membrane protease YdiL (CAAX protease family)